MHHHRSLFAGKNKAFKGKSKGRLKRKAKGKLGRETRRGPKARVASNRRADRLNTARILARSKRNALLRSKKVGFRGGPPRVIAILPLSATADVATLRAQLMARANGTARFFNPTRGVYSASAPVAGGRQARIVVIDSERTPGAVLDATKAADVVLAVVCAAGGDDGGVDMDAMGDHLVALLKAQGLPTVIGIVAARRRPDDGLHPDGRRPDVSPQIPPSAPSPSETRACKRWLQSAFESPKCVVMTGQTVSSGDDNGPIAQALRWAMAAKLADISWRSWRPYMVCEAARFVGDKGDAKASTGTLYVRGHLRGDRGLSARQLVHLTGYGDFQVSRIDAIDPKRGASRSATTSSDMAMDGDAKVDPNTPTPSYTLRPLSTSTPTQREPLQSLNPLDETAEKIVTREELADAARRDAMVERKASAPAGMEGMVKSVWDEIGSDDDDGVNDGVNDGGENEDGTIMEDEEAVLDEALEGEEDATLARLRATMAEAKAKEGLSAEEIRKLERDEVDFPDELELHPDTVARTRFAKYRGLQNFRKTPWDKRENLPAEYGQIVQFENFSAARRRVLSEPGCGCGGDEAPSGAHVQVTIQGVPSAVAKAMATSRAPLLLWGLFKYERKVSVLHFLVRRHANECESPVKSKAPMAFSVGFRRFRARPIYTQDCHSEKFKVDRYLQLGRWCFASVYGRVLMTPATVLMFRASSDDAQDTEESTSAMMTDFNPSNSDTQTDAQKRQLPPDAFDRAVAAPGDDDQDRQGAGAGQDIPPYNPLIASGTLASVDPDRLLIKRVVLTGAPISVTKRLAVIRHMFHRPSDVRWFKPVELWTKHGLVGHIQDPHGTRGYMKANFDGHIKNHDTVCMSLYKRQYPPFSADEF